MTKKKTKPKEQRAIIATANACRSVLYMHGFLSETENEKVFKRILKYQDKHQVAVSREQLDNVCITYNEND